VIVTKEEQLRRGQAAAELLDSGVFSLALDGVEAELSEAWKSSNPVDVAGRERMYLMVQLISDIGRLLHKWKGDVVVAHHEAERARRASVN
jgi:hypothetical protein